MSILDADQIECYDIWDVEIISIPPRSRLYNLEPIGIGTPYVESLTSYITRLAQAHCMTPQSLVRKIILPELGRCHDTLNYGYRFNNFRFENSSPLNGISPISAKWVEVLQNLTSRQDLRFLTLLTWRNVLAVDRLLCKHKRWCLLCLEEWKQRQQPIYEPLIWALNGIDICLWHQRLLTAECPQCLKRQPILTEITLPGYCSFCEGWFGDVSNLESTELVACDTQEASRQRWVVEGVGEMLEATPNLLEIPQQGQFAFVINACVENMAKGRMSVLARLLNITVTSLWGYIQKGDLPYINSFLHICYTLSIPQLKFLTMKENQFPEIEVLAVDQWPMVAQGRGIKVKIDDIQRVREILANVLTIENVDFSPSISEIVAQLGLDAKTLRKYYPELYKAIIERQHRILNEEALLLMKETLERILNSEEHLPLTAVAREVGYSVKILHRYFPVLCQAIITKRRERFEYERIEKRLNEVLNCSEEVPSVNELAREMNYPQHIFRDNFRNLCQQISARRYAERNVRHVEKQAAIAKGIRQAVIQLHKQNIYPGIRQVCRLLDDKQVLRPEQNHEVWLLALQDLGYNIDKQIRHI
jgi:TniQ